MIFTTQESHIKALKKLARNKPNSITIASFGVYAGILHDGEDSHGWGGKYKNETHELLDIVADIDTKILIGFPPLNLCKDECVECVANHYRAAARLVEHSKKWGRLDWRYIENFHLKCYLFYYKSGCIGIGGGRNMSSSSWTDMSFVLSERQVKAARELFDNSWKKSYKITMENLESTIESQMEQI